MAAWCDRVHTPEHDLNNGSISKARTDWPVYFAQAKATFGLTIGVEMKSWKVAVFAALSLAIPITGNAAGASPGAQNRGSHQQPNQEATYTVTLRNVSESQYLTPPNFAAHTRSVDVFQRGHSASAGVQAVAENGAVPTLAAELKAAIDDTGGGVSGIGGPGPIAPGEERIFEFTTSADRLSIVSMLVCTNDGFAGLDSKRLPGRDGGSRWYKLRGYDAGTEINTEMRVDTVPAPFCDLDGEEIGTGTTNPELAENGVIRRHNGIQGVGDIDPSFDFDRVVAEVEITRTDPTPSYTVTVENVTEAQYMTPPNFAAHGRSVSVFQPGKPASPGVQAVAENGDVPVLAGELMGAIDDVGNGLSGVAGEGPFGPGESVSFEFTSDQDRLSVVSMLICTNDGFAGLNGKRLPRWSGDSRRYHVRGYDAGTETNTEMRIDTPPAPFCDVDGQQIGTGTTNPELAEDGVIRRHRGIQGVGDIDTSFDFGRTVMKITVTRN